MTDLTMKNDQRYTLQEIADVTGAAYRTVAAYAQKVGWTRNGEKTLLTEPQAAIIIEAMKEAQPGSPNQTLQGRLQGVTTELSPVIQLKSIQTKKDELHRQELAIYEAENQRLLAEKQALQIRMDKSEKWQTVKRYVRDHGYSHTPGEMKLIGRELSRMSRESGYEVRKAADANYGEVNCYNLFVLRDYFEGSL